MSSGYCTHEDVRRALQESNQGFHEAELAEEFVTDALTAQTEWLEKSAKRHWYEPDGIDEDVEEVIPTTPKERSDEEDINTRSAFVVDGDGPTPKRSHANYTRIRFARRDVKEITGLRVLNADGKYVDWVSDPEITSGRFGDYYVQVNNDGWSELYLSCDVLDELESYARAVYVEYTYGHEGIPQNVRRAIALRAGAQLIMDDDAQIGVPDSGQLVSLESKASQMRDEADRLLETHL